MIPLFDISMVAILKRTFPDLPVVFAPSELARKRLSATIEQENTNLPGLSVFRTSVSYDDTRLNREAERTGFPRRLVPSVNNPYDSMEHGRRKYETIEYEVAAYSYKLSERNDIERELAFMDVYQTLDFSFEDVDYTMAFSGLSAPTYNYELEDRNDKIRYFSLSQTFTAYGYWMLHRDYKLILKIIASIYEEITNGTEINNELLSRITISAPNP